MRFWTGMALSTVLAAAALGVGGCSLEPSAPPPSPLERAAGAEAPSQGRTAADIDDPDALWTMYDLARVSDYTADRAKFLFEGKDLRIVGSYAGFALAGPTQAPVVEVFEPRLKTQLVQCSLGTAADRDTVGSLVRGRSVITVVGIAESIGGRFRDNMIVWALKPCTITAIDEAPRP